MTMSIQHQVPDPISNPQHPTQAILRRVWERLNRRNEHWMHCIVGEEGSGKSHTALKLGYLIDESFSHENVFFSPADLLEVLRNEEFEAGDVYVIDEAGVGLGKRTWQDKEQVKINQALQLIRSHNVGVIFTLPSLGELDSQTETRLQTVYEVLSKEEGEYVKGNWWMGKSDRMGFSGETWWDKPTFQGQTVETISFTPPPDEIVEPYEERKETFQQEFYDEAINGEDAEDAESDDGLSPAECVTAIKQSGELTDLLSWHGGHNKWTLSKQRIREKHDLSIRDAKSVKDRLVEDPEVDIQEAIDAKPDTHARSNGGQHS